MLHVHQSIGKKVFQKYDIYTNEEGIYELFFFKPTAEGKRLQKTALMYCFLMFDRSLVISYM